MKELAEYSAALRGYSLQNILKLGHLGICLAFKRKRNLKHVLIIPNDGTVALFIIPGPMPAEVRAFTDADHYKELRDLIGYEVQAVATEDDGVVLDFGLRGLLIGNRDFTILEKEPTSRPI